MSQKKLETEKDSSSLSLSLPMEENIDKTDDISEHISPNTDSLENDRSFQEIEISNFQGHCKSEEPGDINNTSQEIKPCSLDASLQSENSIISLNYLEKIEDKYVRNILENILKSEAVKSEKDSNISSKEESFNFFKNLDLDDKSLSDVRQNAEESLLEKSITNLGHSTELSINEKNLNATHFGLGSLSNEQELNKRLKDFEELIAIKDNTIAALTCELDSFRENSNTNTISTLSTTEYKQLQEEWQEKLLDFNSTLVYKNELIQQLTESLNQSVIERKEMLLQIDDFKNEIAELKEKINNAPSQIEEAHKESNRELNKAILSKNVNKQLEHEYEALENNLNKQQQELLEVLNLKFNGILEKTLSQEKDRYEKEIKELKINSALEKEEFESEISKLRTLLADFQTGSSQILDIKNELDTKHSKEMEELRTYFERKCADLEKNYSEEIFSQHSRKMSSSSCSDAELNSDLPFPITPGPEGDIFYDVQPNLTKKDIINLHNELSSIITKISKCDLDAMTDEDFLNLNAEIGKSNLRNLLKYDVLTIKNKHNKDVVDTAKSNNEKKLNEIKELHENNLKAIRDKYEEDIEKLRNQLENLKKHNLNLSSTVQEVGSSGEFEINEVIQSYERRLQEQVTLAKIDIISALEAQIQRLAANEVDVEEWPSELLGLKDRFTKKYEDEINDLKEDHKAELEKLKEEHLKVLNGALERARRRSLRDGESLNRGEIEILKERDTLKRQVSSMRNLLGELLKYFTQCEDELNNTLVDELLKQGFDKNLSQMEDDLNLTQSSPTSSSKTSDSTINITTRVHLTPNFTDLINIIEISSTEEGDSKDISIGLKNELSICLEKLKQEANAILTLTNNMNKPQLNEKYESKSGNLEEQITSLTRKLISESQVKEELKGELEESQRYVETLEKERERLEIELERVITKVNNLEDDLTNTKNKFAQLLESGRKEIVSEGYGEAGVNLQSIEDTMSVLADLQEKARNTLSLSRASADSNLLHLIEELCRVGEKIKDESKKERYDLLQQIEAADKKYKTTQKFLEEQAMEREQERDEAQKKIDSLFNQLKDRDKDKVNSEIVASEIEQLDHQLQEKSLALVESVQKIKEVETERNEAVEKINVLRDIIRDLEIQTESKAEEINKYLEAISKLQSIIAHQEGIDECKKNDSHKDVSDIGEMYRHIEHLENELQTLRLQSELAGNEGAAKQIRTQLYEIESQVDRKTKELETLHSTGSTNCSSPSEDVSARDLVLPKSPKKMEDCEVPLQQLARLKEKLVRHSRAEDAAMKRIRDLEMQMFGLKHELEESVGEKEYMKKQIQEQLVLISDFQIRLDEQRIRADNIEKQTNTTLELKIYDLQNEITFLREKLQQKEKHINNQLVLLTETQERLRNLENEVSSSKDDDLIVDMQKEIDKLRSDNAHMRKKIKNEANMVPNLVENIISDKNIDMERLRLKLDDTEKLLEAYTSLNLDKKDLQTLVSLKSNGTSLEEIFSILDLSQADQMRRMESRNNSETLSPSLFLNRRKSDETLMDPELSSIVGPNTANSAIQTRNSTEITHKKVHFEDVEIDNLKKEVSDLKNIIDNKDKIIQEYEQRLNLLDQLEVKIEKLQKSLEETELTLTTASETFQKEQKELKDREKDLGVELAEKRLQLEEKQKQLDVLEQDSKRKDEMCKNLTKEKKDFEKELTTLKHDNYINVDNAINVKNKEMEQLKNQLTLKMNSEIERMKRYQEEQANHIVQLLKEMETLSANLKESQLKNKTLEENIGKNSKEINVLKETVKEQSNEISKSNKELKNKVLQIESIMGEMSILKEKLNKKRRIIREMEDKMSSQKTSVTLLQEDHEHQKSLIVDKNCTIDILNEDAERYQRDIAILESEIKELKKGDIVKLKEDLKQQEEKMNELNKEKTNLLELLNKKEKMINQMAEDSHKLHVNLVTIKSKIKEPGNIIDLGNKLREEQRKTAELFQEIHNLKVQLLQYKNNEMTSSVDEIANQLKNELDKSIKIDSNIMSAVSDHSLSSISETQDVEAYKKALLKEKANKKQLLQHVHKLQAKITELQNDLEKERVTLLQTRTADAQCIQQLRIQLDNALDNEDAFKKVIAEKEKENNYLEKELESAKRKSVSSTSKSESTEYKQLPSNDVIALNNLRREFEVLQGEKNKAFNELAALKQSNIEMETGYKCTKDLLALEIQRKKSLEEKVHNLQMREKELKAGLMQKNLEMERVVDEISQEKADLIKQKLELLQRLKSQQNPFEVSQSPQFLANAVPDELLDKIKELNSALIDNKKMMDLITRISNEKKQVENELEILRAAVKNSSTQLPTNDLIARADYLFANTLKLESTKKALIFQKRYLMQYLMSQKRPTQALPDPMNQRRQFRLNFTSRHRFRSIVFVVISILRMKFLVRRWHSGVRIAEKINSRHYKHPSRKIDTRVVSTHFQVGQPVSNQFFLNPPTAIATSRNLNPFITHKEEARDRREDLVEESIKSDDSYGERIIPWSGLTPPSKERRNRITIGASVLNKEDMNPLKAPQLLAQFVERFDQIQEKLGVVLESNST